MLYNATSKTPALVLLFIFCSLDCFSAIRNSKQDFWLQDSSVRMGKSSYYITVPTGFKIDEARGKEGQVGYNIIPVNTDSKTFAFIEIEKGMGIRGSMQGNKPSDSLSASFMGKEVQWHIENTETGYFFATIPPGDTTAYILAQSMDDIKKLVAMFATLVKK